MYVSAGVGGVAAVLPFLQPRVQSRYFLDTPRLLRPKLTNFILLTAEMIIIYETILPQIDDFHSFFHRNMHNPLLAR